MAKSLKNLIRLHEWRLDERRRELAELLLQVDGLEGSVRQLDAEVENEKRVASADPMLVGQTFGAYAMAAKERREGLQRAIAEKEKDILVAREGLATQFRELKTIRVTQEERDRKERAELDVREQAQLDEIATQKYLRDQRNA